MVKRGDIGHYTGRTKLLCNPVIVKHLVGKDYIEIIDRNGMETAILVSEFRPMDNKDAFLVTFKRDYDAAIQWYNIIMGD
jgi:hypothetical protein